MDKRIERLIRQVIQEQPALVGSQQAQKLKQPGTMLGYGSRGELVKNLQNRINLCNLGMTIKEDGVFGVQTLIGLMKANKGSSEKIDSNLIPNLCKATPTQVATTPTKPTAQSGALLNLQADGSRNNFGLTITPKQAFVSTDKKSGNRNIYLNTINGSWIYSTNCQLLLKNQLWNLNSKKYETCDDTLKTRLTQQFCKAA